MHGEIDELGCGLREWFPLAKLVRLGLWLGFSARSGAIRDFGNSWDRGSCSPPYDLRKADVHFTFTCNINDAIAMARQRWQYLLVFLTYLAIALAACKLIIFQDGGMN